MVGYTKASLQSYRVGAVTITAIHEMSIEGFLGASLFPTLDLGLLSDPAAGIAPDQQQRPQGDIVLPVNVWLVRMPMQTILIDTGVGNGKSRSQPAFDHLSTSFIETLAAAGVTPDQVDLVLLTHLHVDHVGWNTQLIDGKWECTFPNAAYYCSRLELEPYTGQPDLFADSIEPVVASGRMNMLAGDAGEIVDGIRLEATPGHTKGHVSIILTSAGKTAYFGGDLAHHPIQVYDPSVSTTFCSDRAEAERSRRRVFAAIANTDTLFFSTHFSGQPVGRIKRMGERYVWNALQDRIG